MFHKNLKIILAFSDKTENEVFEEIGMHPKSRYNWKNHPPKPATLKKLICYFIESEKIPASLFENDAIFNNDFAEVFKESLRAKPEPILTARAPTVVYEGISSDEEQLIPCLRKIYGSALSKPVIDRICDLLEALGIDSPLFTSLLNFAQKRPK